MRMPFESKLPGLAKLRLFRAVRLSRPERLPGLQSAKEPRLRDCRLETLDRA